MRGKLIVLEGTDCSGKETQTNMLIERLKKEQVNVFKYWYPHYESPTGKIIGGPYLGKEDICEAYFEEGAANVDPKVATLYYAADFKYSSPLIEDNLSVGNTVVLDRYCFSSYAHQGGKIKTKDRRIVNYKWLDNLFFDFLNLRKPDLTILLYMPYEQALKLKQGRTEKPDQHERDEGHLKGAERAYLELAEIYGFKIINCVEDNKIKTMEQIHEEVYECIKKHAITLR